MNVCVCVPVCVCACVRVYDKTAHSLTLTLSLSLSLAQTHTHTYTHLHKLTTKYRQLSGKLAAEFALKHQLMQVCVCRLLFFFGCMIIP